MLSHSVRPNLFAAERTWAIEPDALTWTDRRRSGRVAYRDITQIRLVRTASRATPGFVQAMVDTRTAGRLVISGAQYVRLGRTEDRRATYGPLIRALVRRVSTANPAVRLVTGYDRLFRLLWMVLAALGGFAVAVLLLGLVFHGGTLGSVTPAIAIAAVAPMAWQVIRGGKARPFTADTIPEELV